MLQCCTQWQRASSTQSLHSDHPLWCAAAAADLSFFTVLATRSPGGLFHQARQRWWLHDRWCESSRGKPQHPADLALNIAEMDSAAQLLLGSHDFSTFMDNKRPAGDMSSSTTSSAFSASATGCLICGSTATVVSCAVLCSQRTATCSQSTFCCKVL